MSRHVAPSGRLLIIYNSRRPVSISRIKKLSSFQQERNEQTETGANYSLTCTPTASFIFIKKIARNNLPKVLFCRSHPKLRPYAKQPYNVFISRGRIPDSTLVVVEEQTCDSVLRSLSRCVKMRFCRNQISKNSEGYYLRRSFFNFDLGQG